MKLNFRLELRSRFSLAWHIFLVFAAVIISTLGVGRFRDYSNLSLDLVFVPLPLLVADMAAKEAFSG